MKMPVHMSQVSMPGTGVVTVMIRFMQYGHVNCTGFGDSSLATLNSSWGRGRGGTRQTPRPTPIPPLLCPPRGARPHLQFLQAIPMGPASPLHHPLPTSLQGLGASLS